MTGTYTLRGENKSDRCVRVVAVVVVVVVMVDLDSIGSGGGSRSSIKFIEGRTCPGRCWEFRIRGPGLGRGR